METRRVCYIPPFCTGSAWRLSVFKEEESAHLEHKLSKSTEPLGNVIKESQIIAQLLRSHKVGTPVICSLFRSQKKLSFRVASYLEISLYYRCESGGSQIGRPEHFPVDSLFRSGLIQYVRGSAVVDKKILNPIYTSVDNTLFVHY